MRQRTDPKVSGRRRLVISLLPSVSSQPLALRPAAVQAYSQTDVMHGGRLTEATASKQPVFELSLCGPISGTEHSG